MKNEDMKNIAPKLTALKATLEPFKMPDMALDNTELAVLAQLIEMQLKLKTGTDNPFKITNQYFENFEDTLTYKLDKAIQASQKRTTLKVPEDYFDTIEHNVLLKLKTTSTEKEVKVVQLRARFIKFTAITAVAASLTLLFIFNPFQPSVKVSFDSLALSDIENWINQDNLNLDAYQIAAVYNDVQLQSNLINSNIKEDDLVDYLNHEDVDVLIFED